MTYFKPSQLYTDDEIDEMLHDAAVFWSILGGIAGGVVCTIITLLVISHGA